MIDRTQLEAIPHAPVPDEFVRIMQEWGSAIERDGLGGAFGARRCWLVANAHKCPCDRDGRPLKGWNTAGALLTYPEARARIGGPVRYLGLRMDAVPKLAALDLDDCLNDSGGCIDPVAASIWARWPSRTEITPSGRGLRIWWDVYEPADALTVQTRGEFGRELYHQSMRFLIATNRLYDWGDGPLHIPEIITPDDLAAIAQMLRDAARQQKPEPKPEPARPPEWGGARRRAIGGVLRWLSVQQEGARNNATYWAAHRLRDAGMPEHEAREVLLPITRALGLPEHEAARTVASAYGGQP